MHSGLGGFGRPVPVELIEQPVQSLVVPDESFHEIFGNSAREAFCFEVSPEHFPHGELMGADRHEFLFGHAKNGNTSRTQWPAPDRDPKSVGPGKALMVVGLTGKYCAGKGTAARVFASMGFRVIDADELSHEVLAGKAAAVIARFGPGVRAEGGGVNRRALGRIVFADPTARAGLEAILYPEITDRIRRFIAEGGDVAVNAPLLQRAGLQTLCDAVVFVTAPAPIRLLRALRRDRLSLREAVKRIGAQDDVDPQKNDPSVDTYIVRNAAGTRSFDRRVSRLALRLRG
jgi:dephospho-CoA kinase